MGDNPLLAPKGFGVAKTPWRAVQAGRYRERSDQAAA
jgi:hypothetical protein